MTTPDSGDRPGEPGGTKESEKPGGESRTFTQEEVNAIAAKARAEGKDSAAPPEDYEAVRTERDELLKAQETEAQRRDRLLAESQAENARLKQQTQSVATDAAIRVAASKAGLENPDHAVQLVSHVGITFDPETRTVDGADEAVAALLAENPYLRPDISRAKAPNVNPGGKPAEDLVLTQAQQDMAHKLRRDLPPAEAEAEYKKGLAHSPSGRAPVPE